MTDASARSRVLTLVFTDLADSTGLKTAHGDYAVGDLIARHRAHVESLAADCSGRIIDWAGDGCFLTFETSSAGVLFALRLQQAHATETDLPKVRVGVHMGEVTEKPGPAGSHRVEGLAVDIAARICSLARPGQVLMSSAIYHSARQRLGIDAFGKPVLWQLHGTYALKGFDSPLELGEAALEGVARPQAPVRSEKARPAGRGRSPGAMAAVALTLLILVIGGAIWLSRPGTETASPTSESASGNPIDSLAVLPLDNLSGDASQDYFADGMTEAITAELAKIGSIRVKSRTSVMRFKQSELSLPEIAQELNVEGLIEGSVQRDGDQVRITVQFIDGRSDDHVWSESYTNTISSVLALQSEVALAIATAVEAELTGAERARIGSSRVVVPEAYDAFLLGIAHRSQGTPQGLTAALADFDKATMIDPNFAEAWAYIAMTNSLVIGSGMLDPTAFLPRTRNAAVKALELDDGLAEAHLALGVLAFFHDADWIGADQRFRKALELDPNNALAHMFAGLLASALGRRSDAVAFARKSIEIDDQNPWQLRTNYVSLAFNGQPQEAITGFERLLKMRPDFLPADAALALTYRQAGQTDRAIEMGREIIAEAPMNLTNALFAQLEAIAGNWEAAKRALAEAEQKGGFIDPMVLAWPYVYLGDLDAAFNKIEQAIALRTTSVFLLRVVPYGPADLHVPAMTRFRNDPRYRETLARLKLPPLPPDHPGYAEEQAWLATTSSQ